VTGVQTCALPISAAGTFSFTVNATNTAGDNMKTLSMTVSAGGIEPKGTDGNGGGNGMMLIIAAIAIAAVAGGAAYYFLVMKKK
jgi:hypothetical protein